MSAAPPVELAVIGAGIVGLSAAFWARRRHPDWSVVVIDRSLAGSGATRYSAAICTPLVRSAAWGALAARSLEAYEAMGQVVSLARPRAVPLVLVASPASTGALAGCLGRSPDALAAARVPRAEVPAPLVAGPEDLVFGGQLAASRDARRLAAELALHLTGAGGVRLWDGASVDGVERRGALLALHLADGRQLISRRVIAATGPWLPGGPGAEVAARAGVRIKKVAALHLEAAPAPDAAMAYLFDHGAFLAPLHHERRWLFSFASQEWDCAPEATRLEVTAAERRAGIALLERYFPALAASCSGARVFCDAYTPDGIPVVERVPGLGDFIVAGAASGAGFRLGPGMGVCAVEAFSSHEGEAA